MFSSRLKKYQQECGVNSVSYVNDNGERKTISHYDCELLEIDEETGGIWYISKTSVIPIERRIVYLAPRSVTQIAFKPFK